MEQISYKLEVFEGPMDLLLYLITKHKLDINDIPIFELVEQYTSYVRQMQDENMDVSSDFVLMAARLVYIKTVSLLPVYEQAEELKKELSGELIEYRDCKLLAEKLSESTDGFDYLVRRPEDIEPDYTYTRLHEPEELLRAYSMAAGKKLRRLPPPIESFRGIIAKKIVAVSSKIDQIMLTLKKKRKGKLSDFFLTAESKSDLIASFLAVLELAKNKRILVTGEGDDADIELVNDEELEIIEGQ